MQEGNWAKNEFIKGLIYVENNEERELKYKLKHKIKVKFVNKVAEIHHEELHKNSRIAPRRKVSKAKVNKKILDDFMYESIQ